MHLDNIRTYIKDSMETKARLLGDDVYVKQLNTIADALWGIYEQGGKLLIAGNGGSAADAQHFAAEITGRFLRERKARSAIALHVDTSALTAWSNDYSFDTAYARLVEAYGTSKDALFLLSTSGNSQNLIHAARVAREQGMFVCALLGKDGGELVRQGLCTSALIIPSSHTPHIQEAHIMCIHILCTILDEQF